MAKRVFIIEDKEVAKEVEAMLERKRINTERRRVNSYNPHVSCSGSCSNTLRSCGGSRLYKTPSCSGSHSC